MSPQAKLTFHKNTFFELATGSRTLFIDPVFSHERRGRRVADEVRSADYVLATSMTPWFEDVLDVLDMCDATFVATSQLTRNVSRELGLKKSRLLDLEPWERASEAGLRITALPIHASIGVESSIEEGTSILRDASNVFPRGLNRIPMLGSAVPMLDFGVQNLTKGLQGITSVARPRSVDRVGEMFGMEMGQLAGGRPGLGYMFELEGFPAIVHLADGVHGGTTDDDLEDIADVCEPHVLVMHVDGMEVEPVARAAKILEPKVVLLYRSRDPYTEGRRGQTLPMSSFMGAIEEALPRCEVLSMRKKDSYILESKAAQSAPKSTAAPTITASTPKYSSTPSTPKP